MCRCRHFFGWAVLTQVSSRLSWPDLDAYGLALGQLLHWEDVNVLPSTVQDMRFWQPIEVSTQRPRPALCLSGEDAHIIYTKSSHASCGRYGKPA